MIDPDALRAQREALGVSREEAAALAGVSPSTVYRWENGMTENPQRRSLLKMSRNLGIKLGQLWQAPDVD